MSVKTFEAFLYEGHEVVHFLFVNDGSTDNTQELINKICDTFPERAKTKHLVKNGGKAEAIRQGMLFLMEEKLKCDYAGFMDADLATPLDEIERAYQAVSDFNHPSMIVGSRIKLFGSTEITRSDYRHYVGRVIATFISRSLKLDIYDTQCGFKFIRADRMEALFKDVFISRWLFDVEMIFRLLIQTGYSKIHGELIELPVTKWEEKGGSKIPISYALRIPFELMKIGGRYKDKITG